MKALLTTSLVLAIIALAACGDDSTGPSSELTPSTLSLEFTGDSSKVDQENTRSVSTEIDNPRPTGIRAATGPKGSCEVTATWTLCTDSGFDNYSLYRSESSGISSDPSAADVLGVFSDPNTSSYVDNDVDWSTEYYYALKNTDTDNNSAWSNECSITTPSSGGGGNSYPDSVVATINVGDYPWGICSLPSGDYVYVVNYYDHNVSVIRTSDNSIVATVNVGYHPYGICALPSGDYVYVTNWDDGNVSVIRTSDNSIVATVNVGNGPYGICALPSGDYVYVAELGRW